MQETFSLRASELFRAGALVCPKSTCTSGTASFTRQAPGVLFAYPNREVSFLSKEGFVMKYIPLSLWWSQFEVSFRFRPEIFWAATYIGTYLVGENCDEESVWWNVIMSE